jgi:chromosomal replication initiator protein
VEAGRLRLPSQELETTWNGIREELRRTVTDLTFHLWLDPLELAGREGQLLYVRAPRHIRTLVEERYLPLLRGAAERALASSLAVRIVGEEWAPSEADGPAGGGGDTMRRAVQADLLNPRYTFDQFVIGNANRLAHAAALAVAEQPGQAYNPLFLYGPPGLGKTHLLHAIGSYVRRYGGGVTVRYATSDEFTSSFVRAVRGDGLQAFKSAFRDVDVLLLDDVQFLGERSKTKEEFFHTFNALYENGCQLVVSSDRPPGEMTTFERRLIERFGSGLVAELEAPGVDVRLAILRKRVSLDGLADVGEATLREVATHAASSVRALEGALIRVVAHASLRGEPPSPDLARRTLEALYPRPARRPCTVEDVQDAAASAFGVDRTALVARDRRPQITVSRQIAMYLARELTDESLPSIGARFGGRNHSTILHAHRKIAGEVEHDSDTGRQANELRAALAPGHPDRAE